MKESIENGLDFAKNSDKMKEALEELKNLREERKLKQKESENLKELQNKYENRKIEDKELLPMQVIQLIELARENRFNIGSLFHEQNS